MLTGNECCDTTTCDTGHAHVQKYCADVGGGGMHDAAHADDEDGAAGVFGRRIKETMVPNIARLLRRSRAMGTSWRWEDRMSILYGSIDRPAHAHAYATGHEVVFTVIENLTRDGRDRSLDYKLSCIDVPKGHRHAQVSEMEGWAGALFGRIPRFPRDYMYLFYSYRCWRRLHPSATRSCCPRRRRGTRLMLTD